MTAYVLITGVIFRLPTQKIAKSGKPFTTCTIKVGADDSASSDFWSALCFSESAQLELLRLEVGDAVSVRGKMKIETYVANDGATKISRTIFADVAVGLRPMPRKAKAAARRAPSSQDQRANTSTEETAAGGPAFFSDEIPFGPVR